MKIDLHCHSKHSKRPTLWLMQKLGCPESFTDPIELYHLALQKGMTHVTITDHNVIDGALEIAHFPNTLMGCEYTTYFPEDRCKVHVLVYGMSEAQHEDLSRARESIYDFVDYVREQDLQHVCAHPLFAVNDRLTHDHVERLVILFKNWEWNGDLNPEMNEAMQRILNGLTPEAIDRMADKHGIEPGLPELWKKNLTAGSDDHSSLRIAETYTEVADAADTDEFWAGVANGHAKFRCAPATPQAMARKVYGIAYQFYRSKFALDRYINKDIFLRFLDRSLQTRPDHPEPWGTWFHLFLSSRRAPERPADAGRLLDVARFEAEALIRDDPRLMSIVRDGYRDNGDPDRRWYEFVDRVSNKVLASFGNHVLDRVVGARLFDLFHSIGSAGALYALLAPYFVAYSLFTHQRTSGASLARSFGVDNWPAQEGPRVAHFTDTFDEVNGVARTLTQQLATARALDRDYSIVTCFPEKRPFRAGVHQFTPVGTYSLPEYPELQLLCPPFLAMLQHCYEEGFTHIHSSTPGPVGLAALGIARILKLPIAGTYHTAIPQYAKVLTEDGYIEEMSWRYMIWYYDQLDAVYVPSKATGEELVERGINPDKIKVYPRGVDIERFHPGKRRPILREQFGLDDAAVRLLYVGRVSKEKNLHHLCKAYEALLRKGLDARLVVTGDGPYRNEMESALAGTPAVFTGYVKGDDLAALYADSDVLVFPSTTDTFGNVVLEAQASGIPVIVTDQGGPQENLMDGETGLVVPGNSVSALAEAMESLAADPARRKTMGQAGRAYIEGRSFEKAFVRLYDMYTEETAGSDPTPLPSFESALAQAQALAS